MPVLAPASECKDFIDRLRRVLSAVDLDCRCRTNLDSALYQFSHLESRRRFRGALQHVRRQRDWIAAQLDFLSELDELTERETDGSAFEEMAALFDEIRSSAAEAAQAIREIGRSIVSGSNAGAAAGNS